ncbi:hypothetical protein L5515_015411 [Caenorhabditis briggsae]|uniref:Uncharacterized protein n=2 Tax=Caenorhabditis briggsae TaxID=6238 RepID=A0AAE9EBR8_CAEBR|nr:hypothetical protein L5515_015411 [Caenorhabditis briggsae]
MPYDPEAEIRDLERKIREAQRQTERARHALREREEVLRELDERANEEIRAAQLVRNDELMQAREQSRQMEERIDDFSRRMKEENIDVSEMCTRVKEAAQKNTALKEEYEKLSNELKAVKEASSQGK